MHRLASRSLTRRPAHQLDNHASVCIVDARPEDYCDWQSTAKASGLKLSFFATADEALRHARTQTVDLWIVNAELPGLSGFELCGMLRGRSTRTAVYLVADEYSPAAERAAWASRATAFCCKPGHASLLDEWRQRRQQPTPNATALRTPHKQP